MFCTKCGNAVPDGAKFCSICGVAAADVSLPDQRQAAAATLSPPAPLSPVAAPPPHTQPSPPHDSRGASTFASGIVSQGLIARVKGILLAPTVEWPLIASEASSARAIYLHYVAPLAAIGAIAGLIGQSVIGIGVPLLGTYRTPIVSAFVLALLMYAFTFVVVFVVALLVDALAPTFGGQKDPLRSLKVTAYSYTPAWIAGALQLIPALGILGILAGLYGIYLLYLGLPVLMRCPKDKAIGYSIVVLLCAIVLSVVIGSISALAFGGFGYRAFGGGGSLADSRGDDAVAADAAAGMLSGIFGGKTAADKQRVSDAMKTLAKAGQQAEQAEKAAKVAGATDSPRVVTTPTDAVGSLGALGQILTGGSDVKPVDFRKLKEMLPEAVAGMKRNDSSGESNEAMGIKGSSAIAHYSSESGGRLTVEITDMGSLSGLAGMAARFDPNTQKETDIGYERTTKVNGQLMHERYDRQAKSGEASLLAADRFSITVNGSGVESDVILGALKSIDTTRLGALAAAAK